MRFILSSILAFGCFFTVGFSATKARAAFGDKAQNPAGAEFETKNPLTASARFQPSSSEAGGTVDLIVELTLAEGFHAYADRFKVQIEAPDDLKLDQYRVEPLVKFKDAVSKTMKEGVSGKASLKARVEIPPGFKIGGIEPRLKLTYQACAADYCLFPKTIELKAPLEIRAAEASVGAVGPGPGANATAPLPNNAAAAEFKAAMQKGTLSALLLMFAVGFLTSLTPCVYPMIPITLAVLGVRAPYHGHKPGHWRSFSLAVVYVLGIALTYSMLGVLAASTGGLFGSALSNVWVVSAIALVFVAMGLSMYGHFEVQAPAFIRNRLGGAGPGKGGYWSAFATGLVAGIVASPCIGPVLVSVLAYIAQTQNQVLGFMLLFSFSLGMGVLFIALGVSGSLIARLPRAGSWMESVKYLFGTVMIAMAFYYVRPPVYPQWLFLSLLGIATILLTSLNGALDPLANFTSAGRLKKGAMLALFFFGVATATSGLLTKLGVAFSPSAVAMTESGGEPAPAAPAPEWPAYSPAAFTSAVENGRPTILDFGADWCASCKELEQLTYPKAEVASLLTKFNLFKVDATEDSPAVQAVTQKYAIVGLPTLLFFDAKGRPLPDLSLTGFEDAEAFSRRLDRALGL